MKDKTILEQIDNLHIKTIPGGIEAPKKYRSDKVISYRLFRNNQYIKDVRCESQVAMTDVSFRVLVSAYIYGTWDTKRRSTGKYAAIDPMLELDIDFYKGLWEILTLRLVGQVLSEIDFMDSFEDIEDLYDDDDVRDFSIRECSDDYITYSIMNDIDCTTNKKFCQLMNLPDKFLKKHSYFKNRDNRPEPFDKVLTFFFSAVYHQHHNTKAPVDFWDKNIVLSWKYLQRTLINDLFLAKEYHTEYLREEAGIN
ncbi:hypothetical protein NVP2275O_071 [Vibrio phage 2.275.O._10N.286.54.E11]|nr:hypothetical protein NVP2275O_071 [Vibrio phage 2.275.O._10N.286.54.E11]